MANPFLRQPPPLRPGDRGRPQYPVSQRQKLRRGRRSPSLELAWASLLSQLQVHCGLRCCSQSTYEAPMGAGASGGADSLGSLGHCHPWVSPSPARGSTTVPSTYCAPGPRGPSTPADSAPDLDTPLQPAHGVGEVSPTLCTNGVRPPDGPFTSPCLSFLLRTIQGPRPEILGGKR